MEECIPLSRLDPSVGTAVYEVSFLFGNDSF